MGTGNSKDNWRQESPSSRSASASSASASPSSWASHQSYPQYGPESYNYPPPPSYAPPPEYAQPPPPSYSTQPYSQPPPPSQSYGSDKKRLERKYSRISDNYSSLEQVSLKNLSSWLLTEPFVILDDSHYVLFHLGYGGSCTCRSRIFKPHSGY